jgi:hypothetical protein
MQGMSKPIPESLARHLHKGRAERALLLVAGDGILFVR